jgi:uncharacterized membrane protein
MDLGEKFLMALLLALVAAYAVSYILRDYWSALSSAVLVLALAIIIVERRCRRWCRHEPAEQATKRHRGAHEGKSW